MIESKKSSFYRIRLQAGGFLSIKFVAQLTVSFVLASCSLIVAQQPSADPAGQSSSSNGAPPQGQQQEPHKNSDPVKSQQDTNSQSNTSGTSKDRLFYTLPNFLTLENAGQVPPLTTKQKFGVVTRGSFDYVLFPWYGFLSAISQAENSEPGYGQGWEGYGKRFGAAFADGTIENYMTGAILPSLLHQDPRYFQSGKGSFMRRTFYAASRNVVTRTDSGGSQFNYSEVVGGALSAAISTYSYHPKSQLVTTSTPGVLRFIPSDRTLSNTAKVWGTQYAYDTITIVVKEFWPDIHRKISHRRKASEPAAINPTPTPQDR